MKTPATSLLFGVLVNGLEGSYQSLMLRGLHATAQRLGVNLMCFPGHAMGAAFGLDREFNIVYQLARDAGLHGVVALADTFDWQLPPGGFEEFMQGWDPQVPVVCIGGSRKAGMSSVASDVAGAMARLVDHFLLDHGRRRIAFLKGAEGNTDSQRRLEVFIERHRAAGVPVHPELLIEGRYSVYAAGAAVDALLDRGIAFDALLSANDEMALAAMARLTSRDVMVPEQVAVAGYDDVAGQTDLPIALSSVDQDLPAQAARALEHLVDRVAGRAPVRHIDVPAKLRLRHSCGCGNEASARRFGHTWVDTQRGDALMTELSTALAADLAPGAESGSDHFGRRLRSGLNRTRVEHGGTTDLRTALRLLCEQRMRDAEALPREQERQLVRRLLEAQNALFVHEQTLQAEETLRGQARSHAMWWASDLGPAQDVRGFHLDEVVGSLQRTLVGLGLKTVLLVLYPQPAYAQAWNHFTVPQELTLAMAVVDGQVMPPARLGPFDAGRFLPLSPFGQAGPEGQETSGRMCAVFPLFLHSQHFGYLVLNIDAKLDLSFEQVRSDVSGLITSTALIGELFRTGDRLREDLSRQHDANRRLHTLAQKDDLTGLLNRRGFFTRVAELRQGATPHEALLLVADLDGLKQINDRHGHGAGDKALQAAAQVLATTFRDEDAVARLGGDEFAVFTDDAATRTLPGILHRLQQRLVEHNQASGDPWTVAFSLGTHLIEAGALVSLEEALAAADRALYAAKRQAARVDSIAVPVAPGPAATMAD